MLNAQLWREHELVAARWKNERNEEKSREEVLGNFVRNKVKAVQFALPTDALWYKDAIFYELHVRAFADGNSDGVGDFSGATAKLDYLQQFQLLVAIGAQWRRVTRACRRL